MGLRKLFQGNQGNKDVVLQQLLLKNWMKMKRKLLWWLWNLLVRLLVQIQEKGYWKVGLQHPQHSCIDKADHEDHLQELFSSNERWHAM